ncbi:unnamed protein product [Umbelopsis ramanniana]
MLRPSLPSQKVAFKISVRGSAFLNRGTRRRRNRRAQKAAFSAAITATLSDRANFRNRRRNNRQNQRTDPLTETELTEFAASLTLNPQATDFDELKFKMDMGIALDEMEQEDDAFYQQFDAKLSFDCQEEDDEDSDVHEATDTQEPAQMNGDSSLRTASNPASSNSNHTDALNAQAHGPQRHDATLVNGYGSSHLPTEPNTKLYIYDENDDIETYEDFVGNDWYAPNIDEANLAFYD